MNAVTSYKVAGAQYSPAFRKGWWDGRERLMTHSAKYGYRVPIGLLEDVQGALAATKTKHKVIDNRAIHGKRRKLRWNTKVVARPYQREAVNALFMRELTGAFGFGSGALVMPIRSGKTKTAAMVIRALGLRVLFVVPSQMLLHQTVASLQECFPDEPIGIVGDGECDIQFITVATMQTLDRWRKKKKHKVWLELSTKTDVMVIDEAHHVRGDGDWHKVVHAIDARFRIALSATVYLDSEVEQGRGIIWLKGTIGPVRVNIEAGRLIRAGYLMTQNVRMFKITSPSKIAEWRWSASLKQEGIIANKHRNGIIVNTAEMFAQRGMKVLIVANRLEHIAIISQELWDRNVNHETVTGRDGKDARRDKVDSFVSGEFNVMVGTVFAEGVDIPEVEVVINAEGGRDAKVTMQRMRNMTIAEGKARAMLVDFVDDTNPYLLEHSNERWKVYTSIPEFNVKVID